MARWLPVVAAAVLAVTARAQPNVDWSKAETVSVLLVDNSFVPDALSFRHGVTYRLHLENHGKELHEFTAPEFLADSVVGNPDVLANGGKEVVVQPGQWVDVFLMPLQVGTFKLICADHDWDGMVGEITVK
jgi:uncharacterized cupredoxin-like copper-binding protein